jgi:hypothetical protein
MSGKNRILSIVGEDRETYLLETLLPRPIAIRYFRHRERRL